MLDNSPGNRKLTNARRAVNCGRFFASNRESRFHGRYNADDRLCADRADGVSGGAAVVATESTPGEAMVAAGQGSPTAATPSEITEELSALPPWGTAGSGSDQLGGEAVVRSVEHTREKEEVRDAGLCVSEPGVCLLRPYGRA